MEIKVKKLKKSWLFDFSKTRLVSAIGILGILVLILATALTGTKFTGAFGFKFIEEQLVYNCVTENLIAVSVMTGIFGLLAKKINRNAILIQVLNAVLISRLPFIILTLFNIDDFIRLIYIINLSKFRYELYDFIIGDILLLLFFMVSAALLIAFSIRLLYSGFTSAVGTVKPGYKLYFFVALVIAEFLTKGIIWLL